MDWVAVSIKVPDPWKVIEILGLDKSLFHELNYGRYGFKRTLQYGNISILFDSSDGSICHIVMTGEGCRQYEGQFQEIPWFSLFVRLLEYGANFKRLDIAYDNIDGKLDLEKIKQAIINKEIRTRFKKAGDTKNYTLSRDIVQSKDGHTIFFGNRSSRVYIRFYDKEAQSGAEGEWKRAEVELKRERAQKAVEFLVAGMPVGRLFFSIINTYMAVVEVSDSNISRCPLQPWWAELLETTEKIKLTTAKAIKCVQEVMDYYRQQHAPSLAMIKEYLGPVRFDEFLRELNSNGLKRMGTKHQQILAVSALNEQDNLAEVVEFEELAATLEYEQGYSRQEAEERARLILGGGDE